MGSRVVSADIMAVTGAGAQIDAVASSFAPFMVPSARPVLHYVLDRPGNAERTITLRASAYTWPIAGAYQRSIHLAWVAADPVIVDPTIQSATAWAGTGGANGRTYNLIFNRSYPQGTQAPTIAIVQTHGDLPIKPKLRIYGPITGPSVPGTVSPGNIQSIVKLVSSYRIDVGHWLDIDTNAKTAYVDSDPNQPAMSSIDWASTIWPVIPPAPASASFTLIGTSTSQVTQVVISWQDSYLT
jgi:hypothetical protein